MSPKLSDRQNQALAILAIATAAIGFGLFSFDWDWQIPTQGNPETGFALMAQTIGTFSALLYYFAVLWTTGKILLREDAVTGSELVYGPMLLLAVEMISLAWLFLVDVFV